MSNTISENRLKSVCKIFQGHLCCRYIACGENGFECQKHTGLKSVIDNNIDNMISKGDNCEGLK